MRKATRWGLAVCLLAAALAIGPSTAAARSVHEFEGPIVGVNHDAHKFRLNDRHHGIVKFKVNGKTRYEDLGGGHFGALHKGLRVDVLARQSNGHWIAVEVDGH